jgi:hypothetical protein
VSLFFRIAANACITGGVLLGLVSLAALLYFGTALLQASPPPSAIAAPEGRLLLGFFYGLGKVVSFLGGIADAIIKAFIALSAVGFGLGIDALPDRTRAAHGKAMGQSDGSHASACVRLRGAVRGRHPPLVIAQ